MRYAPRPAGQIRILTPFGVVESTAAIQPTAESFGRGRGAAYLFPVRAPAVPLGYQAYERWLAGLAIGLTCSQAADALGAPLVAYVEAAARRALDAQYGPGTWAGLEPGPRQRWLDLQAAWIARDCQRFVARDVLYVGGYWPRWYGVSWGGRRGHWGGGHHGGGHWGGGGHGGGGGHHGGGHPGGQALASDGGVVMDAADAAAPPPSVPRWALVAGAVLGAGVLLLSSGALSALGHAGEKRARR